METPLDPGLTRSYGNGRRNAVFAEPTTVALSSDQTTKVRSLDYAERWFRDGLELCRPPAFHQVLEVDVGRAGQLIEAARLRGIRLTYTHVLVRAAALVLAAHPDLHAMVCGQKVHYPSRVDIALSVNAETAVAPVIIIEGADRKPLRAIAAEIGGRVPEVREAHRKMLVLLQRWGWLVPFSFLRRGLLRLLYRSFEFRRKGSGTFQVSAMSGVDTFVTPLFNASAILTAGRVRDRVCAVDGLAAVRPIINLTCSADHRVWNGQACQRFLLAVQETLASGQLEENERQ